MNLEIPRFMMPSSSCDLWKSTGAGPVLDKFPAGLRVLAVDDDPICLMILEKMLKSCNYEATVCNRAETGLSLLRENKNGYDIVLSDVHMPDMDGFKLLEHIGLEMDLPVIMMSADDSKSVVMKGVTHGACDYLIKPVRIELVRNIWQHVVRRRRHEWKDLEPLTKADDIDHQQQVPEDVEYSSSANEGHNWKNAKRRKVDEDESEERGESSSKKPRVVWSVELHQQFVAAVNQLGIDKAVPKRILELMNVAGLSRENVASHLQKYRLYLRRLSGSQHLDSISSPFMSSLDVGYGSIPSLNGFDLQALGASGQLPGQSLTTLHAAVPVIDQRNLFSFNNPKSRYGEVNNTPQFLHGIPTNMELKQFAGLHQSRHHSFNSVDNHVLIPMASKSQSNKSHPVPMLPVSVSPNGMLTHGSFLNGLNQIRPHDSGFQDIGSTFNDMSSYSFSKKMGSTVTFSGDDSGTHHENIRDNQDGLLTAILKQQHQQGVFGQAENEFGFDGYALDDHPRVT